MEQNRKKIISKITLLFAFTYMTSYITRINLGAVVSEIVRSTGYKRTALATALTGSAVAYGLGQLISGICGDRIRPKLLCLAGLIVSASVNLIFPFCPSAGGMTVLWSINGLAQAFMWPPMVKLMSEQMTDEEYKHSSTVVSWGASVGTIAVYLFSPILLSLLGWKSVFWVCGFAGIIAAALWQTMCIDVPVRRLPKYVSHKNALISPLLLAIMFAIALQGMLRDGVTTWMPSFISDTFGLPGVISIFSGIALPIFGIICMKLAEILYRRLPSEPPKCAGIIFAASSAAALMLYFCSGRSAALSVVFSAALTGCMHGVNLILICMIPPYYKKRGGVSTISGVLNSCTYVGSSVSTYGIAVVSEHFGWNTTVLIWFITALAGTIVCFACSGAWNRFLSTEK